MAVSGQPVARYHSAFPQEGQRKSLNPRSPILMRNRASTSRSRGGLRNEVLQAGRTVFKGRLFYGWWLVGLSSFMLTLMSLTVFQGLGIMLVALERRYGWSRTALSGAFSLARVEGAILGPIEGVLVDRMGTRRMVLIGYTMMGLGFIWLSQIDALGRLGLLAVLPFSTLDERLMHFYGAYMFISLGTGLGGWLALIAMVNNWFNRRRSFAMACSMSGIHLGGLLVPVLAVVIEWYELSGAAMGIGVLLLLITGPAVKAIRDRPEDMGLLPDGDTGRTRTGDSNSEPSAESEEDEEPDFTAMQALKTPAFWMLTIAQVASSVAIVTLALHLVPKLTDTGMTPPAAALVQTAYTLVALPAQFISGYLAERLPKTLMIAFFLFLQGTGILVIALFDSVAMAYVFALMYGIGFGGRSPLTTAIRGDYFGRKAFATIMGISQFPMNVAMIFAPLFAGYMFDTTGTYIVPFTTFAALSYMGAVLMLFVRKPKPS